MTKKEVLNESSSIKELEQQAKNTKQLIDRLNKAYIGLTTDELIKKALSNDKPESVLEETSESKSEKDQGWGW